VQKSRHACAVSKMGSKGMLNRNGFSLIELLITSCIGLLILIAAFWLNTGSLKLFRDVKTTTDNMQSKIPSMELIARYFDRWGVGVVVTSGADCTAYPPGNQKCIIRTAGTPYDEVKFWGNIYGTGVVKSVAASTASVIGCRLNKSTSQNYYYVWRNNSLQNGMSGTTPIPVALNANLSENDADCSGMASTPNVTVNSLLTASTNVTVQAGDFINRAPHLIRLYCAANNAHDGGRYWLYADVTDTSAGNLTQAAVEVAPVDSFQVALLPSGCDAATGGCTAAQVTATFRSQSKNNSRNYGTYTVQRVFGR
jgi:hypothetical protein